jgi:uncharacterized protein YkwD
MGLFEAIQGERRNRGLATLAVDGGLTEIARQRANDMASRGYFSHTTPEGTNVFNFFSAGDRRRFYIAEILARTNADEASSPGVAMSGFMQSPAHSGIIVHSRYQSVGVGMSTGGDGIKYFAVVFTGRV